MGAPDQNGYWTLDQPELRFRLSSTEHHWFMERFWLPRETLKVTGPLRVDFYVNGHLFDQAVFTKDGDNLYQHDVPAKWIAADGFTIVRMLVHNPYIAPPNGDKLGVLLFAASFNPSRAREDIKALASALKNRAKHRLGQLACGSILLAGVIRADQQRLPGSGLMHGIMCKDESGSPGNLALLAQDAKIYIEREPAQRHHHLHSLQQLQIALEVRPAIANLIQRQFVIGRRAARHGADVGIAQFQAVVAGGAGGLRSKSGSV